MVCELQLISDPLFHYTWMCLHHYEYKEALFTAERIFAENPTDEAVFLLATCFYHNYGPRHTRLFLQRQEIITSKCRFLLAKCHFEIGQLPEAEDVLVGVSQEMEGPGEIATFYKDTAPFVLKLLADIYKQTERRKFAINCLRKCVEINPLSWGAYTELIDLHDNIDPSEVFTLPKNVVLNNQSCLRALSNKMNIGEIVHNNCPSKKRSDIHDSQEDLSVSLENVNPKYEEKLMDIANNTTNMSDEQLSYSFNGSGQHVHSSVNMDHTHQGLLPELAFVDSSHNLSSKVLSNKHGKNDIEQSKPLFGNAYLDPSPNIPVFNSKSPNVHHIKNNTALKNPVFRDNSKKNRHNTKRVSFSSLKSTEISTPYPSRSEKTNSYNISSLNSLSKNDVLNYSAIPMVPVSPLVNEGKLSEFSSIDHNSDFPGSSMFLATNQAPRTRSQYAKAKADQISSSSKEYIHSGEHCCVESDTRLQSALHYLQLLISMGRAYKSSKNYKLHDAILHIKQLPRHHSETALVSSWLASAYMEMNDKVKACTILATSFQNEPWQLHGLTLYSSILWVLSKEKDLLYLANEMMELDRRNVEYWCILGNAMSFNKENEVAIRYFQRAIQINPTYSYGYILLGHEYITQDELDKALTSFRRALDLESHNYLPNFFIATVYQRQDNYLDAEKILKETLKMFPDSLMVLTNLAVVRLKLKQNFSPNAALELLEKACRLYPKEAMCRFYKASILYHIGKYTEALEDLKMLELTKEARVYLLMSLIYKHMGQMSKAMVYNTWAIELDPKCTNDSFMLDRNFVGGSNVANGDTGNNSSIANVNSSFLAGSRRNSESMQDDVASNNQIHYDLLDTD